MEEVILGLRRKHPRWGPKKLLHILQQKQASVTWPVTSTIGELLRPSRAVDRLILEHADDAAIEGAAGTDGMRPLFDSGLMAVLEGDTTVEEVLRCTRGEG